MTDVTLTDNEPVDVAPAEPARFFIDTNWYEGQGRSFRAMAQGRFCPACTAKVGSTVEDRVPVVEKKSNRVVFETRDVAYGDQPMAVIRGCCSKQRNYITPDTPLLEAVFRVFLATGNQPATIERIREQLGDWISPRDRPHNYAEELIATLLMHDRGYGLREFALVT
ncbi:MAG: hypothetical protein EPO26_03955 [Chloroflexota bacterium]|nr:MAG: hypothetical protein EPO26_03955 [Chloroflexota bacterium]